MTTTGTRPDGITLSDDRERIDLDRCHDWLSNSYWARGRSRADMIDSFDRSVLFGAYDAAGRQVALARAVTDRITFAWIADVVVDSDYRGRGIGTAIVSALVEQLKQSGVRRFLLATRDAHEVYARLGFGPPAVPQVLMEIDERPTRPTAADVARPIAP